MSKQRKSEPDDAAKPSFEASIAELEAVVKQLESADLPLEKAVELFEKGMKLSEACRAQLLDAETRVEILLKKGDTVQPAPFNPEEE